MKGVPFSLDLPKLNICLNCFCVVKYSMRNNYTRKYFTRIRIVNKITHITFTLCAFEQ